MSRARLTLIVNNGSACSQTAPRVEQKSWSKKLDPYALKASAAELWAGYFHTRFHSPREVALFCDVSFQTALNWWGAVTAPASHISVLVMLTDPDAPAYFAAEMGWAA